LEQQQSEQQTHFPIIAENYNIGLGLSTENGKDP